MNRLTFGDLPGHEFHGNQYTDAVGSAVSSAEKAHKLSGNYGSLQAHDATTKALRATRRSTEATSGISQHRDAIKSHEAAAALHQKQTRGSGLAGIVAAHHEAAAAHRNALASGFQSKFGRNVIRNMKKVGTRTGAKC